MKNLQKIFKSLFLGIGKFISIFSLFFIGFILLLAVIPNGSMGTKYIIYAIPIGTLIAYILIHNLKKECKAIFIFGEYIFSSIVILFTFMESDIIDKHIKDEDNLEISIDKMTYIVDNYFNLFLENLIENYISYILIFSCITIFYYLRYYYCKTRL
ncbi:MAG TPA: hypothetical protein EYG80_03065 [Flavobacteriaceae bacterium]|nr:hypothetical protein [Flavobacteriaceae bacterium]